MEAGPEVIPLLTGVEIPIGRVSFELKPFEFETLELKTFVLKQFEFETFEVETLFSRMAFEFSQLG